MNEKFIDKFKAWWRGDGLEVASVRAPARAVKPLAVLGPSNLTLNDPAKGFTSVRAPAVVRPASPPRIDYAVEIRDEPRDNNKTFFEKFAAWWRGDSITAASVRAGGRLPSSPIATSALSHTEVKADDTIKKWDGTRLDLLEKLWGDGNAAPTEDEFFGLMYDQLLLNSSNTVLDVGDGFAGAAVHMAKQYKTYVESYVSNPAYVSAALSYVERKGAAKHVTLHDYVLENFRLAKRYDVASLRRTLWRVPNLEEFFITIVRHLKPGGRVVIADYVAPATLMEDPLAAAWFQQEKYQHSLSLDDVKQTLDRSGLQVRVAQDLTAQHLAEIRRGLNSLKEFLKGVRLTDEAKAMVVREADRWAMRAALMGKGLQFYRIFAQLK